MTSSRFFTPRGWPTPLFEDSPGPWSTDSRAVLEAQSPATELEGGRIDAVPETRRPRTVVEHMPQVGPAVGALDLGPPHEQAAILLFIDAFLPRWRPEARPARSGIVLRVRGEQVSPTHGANVNTRVVVVPELSGEGSLGAFVDADVVLQWRELLPKLRLVELLHEDGTCPARLKVSSGGGTQVHGRGG